MAGPALLVSDSAIPRLIKATGIAVNVSTSMLVSVAIMLWALLAPDGWFVASSKLHYLLFLLALALAFPLRLAALVFAAGAAANFALHSVSVTKAALTTLPLTSLDLHIFATNPGGFLGAMKWDPAISFAIAGITTSALIGVIGWLTRQHFKQRGRPAFRAVAASASACILAAASVPVFSERLFQTIKPPSKILAHAWEPAGVTQASLDLGVFPFLLFTAKVDASGDGNRFAAGTSGTAVAAEGGDTAVPALVRPGFRGAKLPNIVLVLLESTFDINRTFQIDPPLKTTFTTDYNGAALRGALNVNAIGGGTWITEFEVLTGIDSRLFGFAGYYTHVSVAPMIKNSLATHLQAKGYDLKALYATKGDFYSGRSGFAHYGFNTFLDSDHFGVKDPWHASDRLTMQNYLKALQPRKTRPLFAYVQTLENHAPHSCSKLDGKPLVYRLKGKSNRAMACQVNDYIRRQQSTEQAVGQLETHLKKIEAATGRPYVLVLFGDHLPHTFVGTQTALMRSAHSYDHLRRTPKTSTFYQIRTSLKSPFRKARLDAPVVLLPTLISAFVARSAQDLYMPVNLALHRHCGSSLAISNSAGLFAKPASAEKKKANMSCKQAIDSAIQVYKRTALK